MSYSTVVKTELCRIRPESDCCALAEAYGLLLYSRLLSEGHDTYATETKGIADLIGETMASVCGVYADVITLPKSGRNGCKYMVKIPNSEQKKLICMRFAEAGGGILDKECCVAAFLRGVFIVCGTVTEPSRDYHLEFLAGSERRCDILADTLSRAGIRGHKLQRGDRWLLYIKGADDIISLLKKMGSVYSVQSIETTKNVRDFRNNANRLVNCDQANIDRTLSASQQQCAAIRRLIEKKGYAGIPPELREIARLRLENPEMTLRDLSENLSEPITRSGVNHRLKKLMELAENQ
ncbi:MAG: DNA-binding protein WhiA [Clostridia bacterium]|nr:DNA-binding protein WhiA [Clostridia bacterium]